MFTSFIYTESLRIKVLYSTQRTFARSKSARQPTLRKRRGAGVHRDSTRDAAVAAAAEWAQVCATVSVRAPWRAIHASAGRDRALPGMTAGL